MTTRPGGCVHRSAKPGGIKAGDIIAAPIQSLTSPSPGWAAFNLTMSVARRLKEIALIVLNEFEGDLRKALDLPAPQAIRALKKFPSIADPGAEKILLFTRTYPLLGLESNGLRVLLRLGFGQEYKNYSTSYRSVGEALADQIGDDCDFLIQANQLLRRHGKTLCKTNARQLVATVLCGATVGIMKSPITVKDRVCNANC
jgi:endonuclease III